MVSVDITAHDMPPASGWELHAHDDEALLSYAAEGSCTKVMAERTWLILPAHALWIPPGVAHGTVMGPRGCRLRAIAFPTPLPHDLPAACCLIEVSPFLASLIEAWREQQSAVRREALCFLIYDEVRKAPRLNLGLPRVQDPRLQRATDALLADPADARDLGALARSAGMSRRSFIRHFQAQTGLGFAEWRRRLRVLMARQLLADGVSVTEAALSLGYGSTSAFIAMVRRETGSSPTQLLRRS